MALSNKTADNLNIEKLLRESEKRYQLLAENVGDAIWTVDMELNPTYIGPSVQRLLGYSIEEAMNKTLREVFIPSSYEMAIETLTEELAIENTGHKNLSRSRTLELELIRKDGSTVPVEVKCSFLRDGDGQPVEILAIARDITQRKKAEEEIKRGTERLLKTMENTIQAMAMIVEMRDPYTAGHQKRVSQLACAIADKIGLSPDRITGLRLAGLIHDIGKVRVPTEILTHPDGLSEAEFNIIKVHPQVGHEILKTVESSWHIADIVYQHHERMDGSGYPLGLRGSEITLEARILAVADVVEAMASHRPYRPALGLDKALAEISQNRGLLYDPEVVDTCLNLFEKQKFKFDITI